MKSRPIIFSGPMVRAILDGRKTQTRRVIKSRHHWHMDERDDGTPWPYFDGYVYGEPDLIEVSCPYGEPGDELWVKETFVIETNAELTEIGDYKPPHKDRRPTRHVCNPASEYWEQPHYRATDKTPELSMDDMDGPGCRWSPSIYMPRWASRITLRINNVLVKRVQDISEIDCYAEGRSLDLEMDPVSRPGAYWFKNLWNSINEKRGYGWDTNPWTWVIDFERIDG